jgi:hypothetical protein
VTAAGGSVAVHLYVTGDIESQEESIDRSSLEKESKVSSPQDSNSVHFTMSTTFHRPNIPEVIAERGRSWAGHIGVGGELWFQSTAFRCRILSQKLIGLQRAVHSLSLPTSPMQSRMSRSRSCAEKRLVKRCTYEKRLSNGERGFSLKQPKFGRKW